MPYAHIQALQQPPIARGTPLVHDLYTAWQTMLLQANLKLVNGLTSHIDSLLLVLKD